MKKRGRPKKDDNVAKRRTIQIRLSNAEKQAFSEAADLSGLPLSLWARERLRKAAREDVRKSQKYDDKLS